MGENKVENQLSLIDEFNKIEYTEEQKEFAYFKDNNSVLLISTAGSGKTAVAVERMKELIRRGVNPDKIIFFSYTKAATEELQERIGRNDVKITTIHAFASGILSKIGRFKKVITFYDFIKWYKERYNPNKDSSYETKSEFYELIGNMYEEAEYISSEISSFKLQNADGIKCQVPMYLSEYNKFLRETRSRDFADMLIEVRDLLREDKWLKMFRNKYDYIFIDEYQDTSTIQLQILLSLNAKYYYLIGDKNQCLYPNTKIMTKKGIKTIEKVNDGDLVLSSIGNNCLNYSKVTEKIINKKNDYELLEIETFGGKKIKCTANHVLFSGFDKKCNNYAVCLLYKIDIGFTVSVLKMQTIIKNRNKVDKIWVVNVFETLNEGHRKINEICLKYKSLENNFSKIKNSINLSINTEIEAKRLLRDYKYDFNNPHFSLEKNIKLFLCNKKNTSSIEIIFHRYDDIIKLQKKLNISFCVNKNATKWIYKENSSDFGKLKKMAEIANEISGYEIKTFSRFNKTNVLNTFSASQIIPGMLLYVYNNCNIDFDIVKRIIKTKYKGVTYDLNIKNVHNFFADEIVVHNSIYGYSGANCDKIEMMLKNRRETVEKTLSVNFRSDKNIVLNSNRFSSLKAIPNSTKDGFVKKYIIFEIESCEQNSNGKRGIDLITVLNEYSEVAVLARTNAVIKNIEFELLKRKYPMRYFNYLTNNDFLEYKKGNVHITLQEKLNKIKPYFNNNEMDVFSFIEYNKNSLKFVTSIHKSKGREFDYCVVVNSIDPYLMNDIGLNKHLTPKQMSKLTFDVLEENDVESRNIHYVAISRAKHGLFYMLYDFQ